MEKSLSENIAHSPTVKKRRPIIAFLFAIAGTGLGQIYNGQLLKGTVFAFGRQIFLYATSFVVVSASLNVATAFGVLVLAYVLYIIIDAVVISFRSKRFTLKPYNKWYFYLFFLFLVLGMNAYNSMIIKSFLMEAYKMPSGSMLPSVLPGDHFIIDRTYARDDNPEREDIIVFKYPKDPKKNFVKRIVAIGGDTVEMKDKNLYINGNAVDEAFTNHSNNDVLPARMSRRDNFDPIQVPEGKVFVLGDNRGDSHDSRFWGFVDRKDIKGKALFIYWSWDSDKGKARFDRIGMTLN